MPKEIATEYDYSTSEASHTKAYLWSPVMCELGRPPETAEGKRVFELGCGNGALARHLRTCGFEVIGVDPSTTGIAIAKKSAPSIRFEIGNAYEDLAGRYGQFAVVISLEVVEHVYYPRKYARCIHDLLQPGGKAIVSTPYHSYLKNIALALSGRMDAHFTALWDHGHIKFWSVRTLSRLFIEQGLIIEKTLRVGRIPMLGKSMILVLRRQASMRPQSSTLFQE